MIANIKKIFKWASKKDSVDKEKCRSLILKATIKLLRDIFTWKNKWLSIAFIIFVNILFFICLHREFNIYKFLIAIFMVIISIDGFETWLKYKHRETFLRRISACNESIDSSMQLYQYMLRVKIWINKKWSEFLFLRETNHTKAFLLVNMVLGTIFFIGNGISGFTLSYLLCMGISVAHLFSPYVLRTYKKIQQHAESDVEIDNLIPVVSEQEMKELNIELEQTQTKETQSLDYWKLEDIPVGETSDSSECSDTSSSLVTNLSKDNLEKVIDDSSNSSDDEYIPLVRKQEQVESTLEIINPAETWSSSAFSALSSIPGAVVNMMYTQRAQRRQRVSSIDSSDGFEVIDQTDLT